MLPWVNKDVKLLINDFLNWPLQWSEDSCIDPRPSQKPTELSNIDPVYTYFFINQLHS